MPGDRYGYTTTKITLTARDALQRATVNASALVGKRLSQSTVLLAAMQVIESHPDDLRVAITELQGDPQ